MSFNSKLASKLQNNGIRVVDGKAVKADLNKARQTIMSILTDASKESVECSECGNEFDKSELRPKKYERELLVCDDCASQEDDEEWSSLP